MNPARTKPGRFYRLRTDFERRVILAAVQTAPTHTAAAKELGLTRTYLLRLMMQLGIPRDRAATQQADERLRLG